MRYFLAVTIVAAGFAAAVSSASVRAQSGGNTLLNPTGKQSAILPWERSLQRYYDRERLARQRGADPLSGLRTTALDRRQALLRRFYGDPARALGLPANPNLPDPLTGAPATSPLEFAPTVSPLDINGDGAVTQQEYFNARARFVPGGAQGTARARRARERLISQFRALDADRDGRITPNETALYPNPRF